MESKRNETAKKIFSETEKDQEASESGQGAYRDPTSPLAAARGPAPPRLVGSLGLLFPRSSAYKFPKIPEKIRRSSKLVFRRRKLLSPQDPIWGTFW